MRAPSDPSGAGGRGRSDRKDILRWVRAILVIFLVMGLSFGTWLSRLPSVRDELDASMLQMSIYGLCLAAGSLAGLVVSGRLVQRVGSRRTLAVTVALQALTLPGAILLMFSGLLPLGLVSLFVFGFSFSTSDIAMNVSGAGAERALGRPRMPLMHAGYSIGAVTAMVVGAVAEALRVPLQAHFIGMFAVIIICTFSVLRLVPKNETELRKRGEAALDTTGAVPVIETAPEMSSSITTTTASIPVIAHPEPDTGSGAGAESRSRRRYTPWRNGHVLLIGLIALSAGLFDGAAADWLPLALVDNRGVSNSFGTVMLGVFFASIVSVRLAGAWLLGRFGRVAVLRASLILAALGVLAVILVPNSFGMVAGTIAWGLGTGICWPVAISAAADRAETAVLDVAAVSAIGYASMLLGPMAFGVLGDHIGLMQAFWMLLPFALLGILLAGRTRPRGPRPSASRR